MPSTALTTAIGEEIARLGSADIMVGIPSYRNAATIGHVVRAAQAGLVQYFPDLRPVLVNADAGSPDGTSRVVVETEPPGYVEQILLVHPRNRLARVSLTYPGVDGIGGKGAALRTLFEMAAKLDVEALVVVDSDLRSIVPEWIELLAGPILKGGYDYVAPLYLRHRNDGTITNTITYPLTRALYGHRIRQPIGGDFGISGDLVRHFLEQESWTPDVSRFGIDIWMTTTALTGGYAVCQSRLGAKIHDARDPGTDLGPMFRQVVGTMLAMARDNSARWLGIRATRDVPVYGFERYAEPPAVEVDTLRLLSQFHAGSLTLAETWGRFLAPESLARALALAGEAGALAETAAHRLGLDSETTEGAVAGPKPSTDELSDAVAAFHFADETWARIVYDLVLAAGFGETPIENLAASFVPLYFGRVASLVIENRRLSPDQSEEHVERQARAFEAEKPYLLERWRSAAARAASDIAGTSSPADTARVAPSGPRRQESK
jgi:glucosylglycerate synthase